MHSIMAGYHSLVSFLVITSTLVASQQCDLQFDGRVPSAFTAATFNTGNGVFDPNNVFGQGIISLSESLGIEILMGIGLDLGSIVQIQDSLPSLVSSTRNFYVFPHTLT